MSDLTNSPLFQFAAFIFTFIGVWTGLRSIAIFAKNVLSTPLKFSFRSFTIKQIRPEIQKSLKSSDNIFDTIGHYADFISNMILKLAQIFFNCVLGIYILINGIYPFSSNQNFRIFGISFLFFAVVNFVEILLLRARLSVFQSTMPTLRLLIDEKLLESEK